MLKKILLLKGLPLVCLLLLAFTRQARSQIFVTYPVPAQGLTRQLDTSLLSVMVSFTNACANTTVNIRFPQGVEYIPGSVMKTGGSPAVTIADNGGTPGAPLFTLSGVTVTSDISFTVKRRALCAAPVNAKDTVVVTGDCGMVEEANPSVNNYTVLAPALTLPAPAALNNMQNYTTFNRTFSVTNGGNGCLDTLYLYIAYPQAGIQLQSLEANSLPLAAYRSNGDTLFFKVAGTQLSTDGQLCNGETITFTEAGRIVHCNTIATFGARWGHADDASTCQTVTATGNMTMAAINQGCVANTNIVQAFGTCSQGIYDFTYTSNGAGNAGALFDVVAQLSTGGMLVDSLKLIAGANVFHTASYTSAGNLVMVNTGQFSSDPDGAAGLTDLDGDGLFDELPSGDSLRLRAYLRWPCPGIAFSAQASLVYNNMCGGIGAGSGNNTLASPLTFFVANGLNRNDLHPAQVSSGTPFNVSLVTNGSFGIPIGPTDTTYLRLLLPEGVGLSGTGNITLNGTAVPASRVRIGNASTPGDADTLVIAGKGRVTGTYSVDLVYTGPDAALNFSYDVRYVSNQACDCPITLFSPANFTITAQNLSIANCPLGISNNAPVVTRRTLGYTDNTLTTHVLPASLSGVPALTMLVRDSLTIEPSGVNHGTQNNIYYSYAIDKAGGSNVLAYAHGTFNIRNAVSGVVTTCALPAPADSGNASVQRMIWNLSACLPAGGLSEGDSVWATVWYAVNAAYNNTRTPVSGTLSYFFSKAGSPDTNIICSSFPSYFYVTSYSTYVQTTAYTSSDCNVLNIGSSLAFRYGTGENLDIYPNEYRPALFIDSFRYTLTPGYTFSPAMTSVTYTGAGVPAVTVPVTISGNVLSAHSGPAGSATFWRPTDLQFVTGFNNTAIGNILIQPTCQAPVTGTNGTGTYYYRTFAYSDNPGIGQRNAPYPAAWPTVNRPVLSVVNNTGNVQGVLDQQHWDIQVNNTGGAASANTWLSLRRGDVNTSIVVDSVNLLAAGNVLGTTLPKAVYSQGTWYQVSAPGIAAANGTQHLRIFFRYTRCTADSLIAGVGWNCPGYPSDPSAYPCSAPSVTLRVTPQLSQVQLSISRQPTQPSIPMCSTDSVIADINSALAANIADPRVLVSPPEGLTLELPFAVEYPLGSGNWQNITPVLTGGEYLVDLTQHSGIGVNGLPGTVVNPVAAGRQARLKVKYSSVCSFVSGSKLGFTIEGNRPCGSPATGNNVQVRSNAINITGATAIGGAGAILTSTPSLLSCGSNAIVNVNITPVVNATSNGDTAVYRLPASIQYNGGFVTGANCTGCMPVVAVQANGSTLMKVKLPPGVPPNTTIAFSYNVTTDRGGCGSDSILCNIERSILPLTCGATLCSSSKVIIGTAYSQAIDLRKPDLELSAAQRISGIWTSGQNGQAALSYTNNGSLDAPANTYQVEFYCGTANGAFYTTTLGKAVSVGSTARDTFTLNFPASGQDQDAITAKVSPLTSNNNIQCLCQQRTAVFDVPLPVVLEQFRVSAKGCTALLEWTTLSEHNSGHFEVEWSADGRRFQQVGTLASYNRVTGSAYTFGCRAYPGANYFRLKMTDLDGASAYSTVAMLYADCDAATIAVHPNPATKEATVTGLSTGDEISLYGAEGRILVNLKASQPEETLDIAGLSPGMYLIKVSDQAGRSKAALKLHKR